MTDKHLLLENKELENEFLKRVRELYHLPSTIYAKLINYSENATYLIEDKDSKLRYILRVNRQGYHSKEALQDEIKWVESILETSSLIVPEPIYGKNGEVIQTYSTDVNSGVQYCTMFSFIKGETPSIEHDRELIAPYEKLGEITAQLHEHSINWKGSNHLSRFIWDYETIIGNVARWGPWQSGQFIDDKNYDLFTQVSMLISERLYKFGKEPHRFGLIHADLRLDNLLFDGNDIKVIDFDDCGYSWYLYDLAAAMTFLEDSQYASELIESWLKGYRKLREISKEEENEIPTFLMLRRMQVIGWLASREDSDVANSIDIKDYTEKSAMLGRKYLQQFR